MLAWLELNVAILLRFVVSVDQQVDDKFREGARGVCRPLFRLALAFDPQYRVYLFACQVRFELTVLLDQIPVEDLPPLALRCEGDAGVREAL